MRITTAFAVSLAVLSVPALTQADMLKPAKEVQKLAPLIGTWTGSGTVKHGPDQPSQPWTSKSTAQWALGGHFVREDLEIDLGEQGGTLAFRNFYGWDRERQRYVLVEVSNFGTAMKHEPRWIDDKTMVYVDSHVMGNELSVTRWVSTFGEGTITMSSDTATNDGKFYQHVSGSMKRTSREPGAVGTVEVAFMPDMNAGIGKLAALSSATGRYKVAGWMVEPGQPKTNISGIETIDLMYGGSVLTFEVKGDPIPDSGMPAYEGWGCWAWNDDAGAYNSVWLSNYGEVMMDQVRPLGDGKYLGTSANVWHGKPAVQSSVMELENGSFSRCWTNAIVGTDEPVKVFNATFEKQK